MTADDTAAAAAAAAAAEAMRVQIIPPPSIDPTTATKESMLREIATLQNELDRRLVDQQQRFEYALEQRVLMVAEQLAKVNQRFELQEQQRIEQKNDTKTAVDAALSAAREAVREQTFASALATTKSETAFQKALEQQAATAGTEASALRRQIDEIKERSNEVERITRQSIYDLARDLRDDIGKVSTTANAYGQQKQGGTDTRQIIGWAVAAVVGLAALAGFVIDIATK